MGRGLLIITVVMFFCATLIHFISKKKYLNLIMVSITAIIISAVFISSSQLASIRYGSIIKGGENIYPAELENVLYTHPDIDECAVIGIPDKLLGEDICAFVKIKTNSQLTKNDLEKFCKDKITSYKQPKNIIIINDLTDLNEIPKGPTKKILYRKLKEYYQNSL